MVPDTRTTSSSGSGVGEAQTDEQIRAARSQNFEVFERDGGNISWEVNGGLGDDETFECWMGGGKIVLHTPGGDPKTDMPLDINDDGTLQTPFGEIKRKGN